MGSNAAAPTRQPASDAEVFRILIVCTANICRSPVAERLLRHYFEQAESGARFSVTSAGVRGWESAEIHPPMAAELRRLGADPSEFSSRPLIEADCDRADLILTATLEHRAAVLQMAPRALRRTFTLLEFAHLVTGPGVVSVAAGFPSELVRRAATARGSATLIDYDIHDPYQREPEITRSVVEVIDQATRAIVAALTTPPYVQSS